MLLEATPHVRVPRVVQANRRAVPRVGAAELQWLERVRLGSGGAVSLINLSARGALFELTTRVHPGDVAELEFVGDGDRTIAAARIVRSEVASIGADVVRYRGACVFAAPLAWARRLPRTDTLDPMPVIATDEAFTPWWGWSEVLVIFRHSRRLRGFVRAFNPSAATIDVWPSRTAPAHQRQTVPMGLLRAIHFLRDFDDDGSGVAATLDPADFPEVHVLFRNSDVVHGGLPGYDPERSGFWILPPSAVPARRIFAVSSAVTEIRVF